MANKIFLVLTNIKTGRAFYHKGQYVPVDEADTQFDALVGQKLMRLVEGATTPDEAVKLITAEIEAAKPKPNIKGTVGVSPNTFGPKPTAVIPPIVTPAKDTTVAPVAADVAAANVDALNGTGTAPAAPAGASGPGTGKPIVGGGDVAPEDPAATL